MAYLALVCFIIACFYFRLYFYHRDKSTLLIVLGWLLAALGLFGGFRPLLIPSLALLIVGNIKRVMNKGRKLK